MIKKLLLLFFIFVGTLTSHSQTVFAFPVPDLVQCNFEVFDLTVQTPVVLGNQVPANYNVGYFLSEADAVTNVNQIVAPDDFVGGMSNLLFIRVTDLSNGTFAITDFTASWNFSPQAIEMMDVTVCDIYILPALPSDATYNTAPNGSGMPLPLSYIVTTSMTIYLWVDNGICTAESSFEVTVISSPSIGVSDVYACVEYTLPVLPAGFSYWSSPSGGGVQYVPGHVITETTTIYIFAESGTVPTCTNEQVFTITIGTPEVTYQQLLACDLNDDGVATFNFADAVSSITMPGIVVTFHETQFDADMGVNALELNGYTNLIPNQQIIYVRTEFFGTDCFVVSELLIVAISCSNSSISGTLTFDADANGCAASDSNLSTGTMILTNDGYVAYAYVNEEGQYNFSNVPVGNNVITNVLPSGFTSEPTQQVVLIADNNSDATADFCVTGPAPVNDAAVYVLSPMAPIPGFSMTYVMKVFNVGTTPLSGSATFTYDQNILSFTSANPAQTGQSDNTVTFNYTGLAPFSQATYYMYFTVFPPPTVNSGQMLQVSAETTIDQLDVNLSNNTVALQQMVLNSYDPNDITVHEGSFILPEQSDDYLHYTIRFQNLGTAPAVNVRIENELSAYLDWSTFMPIAASHMYQAERIEGGLTFRFNNITLPAEQDDEPGSHGWITYKIKPVAGFSIGDVISNGADIFFDFNEAIVTNTVTTQIQQLSVAENGLAALKMYPNPASGKVYVAGVSCSFEVGLFDIQGKIIKTTMLTGNQPLDVSDVESGIYFVEIMTDGKSVTKKLIIN